jgi:hypothetical protein
MRHARCFVNLTAQVQIRITGEGVCLQYAREVGKVTLCADFGERDRRFRERDRFGGFGVARYRL